jgi:WD40 repeat protein
MAEDLRLDSVIGIGGGVPNGLILHPDRSTLIYPLGSTVVVRSKDNPRHQEFLQGHTDKVACIAVSKSGRYLASGQVTHMGFNADIIIWDFETRQAVHRMALHKVGGYSLFGGG